MTKPLAMTPMQKFLFVALMCMDQRRPIPAIGVWRKGIGLGDYMACKVRKKAYANK